MKKLRGVTTAMVTPFTADDRVDYDALSELVEFLIGRGVHCLYPCGTTGEMFHMTMDERKEIAQHVVNQAAGRATVYIHAGSMYMHETILLVQHAADIGADGIGVVTPAFFTANEDEMFSYYAEVAAAVPKDFPVYLYNIPQCAANDLSSVTVKHIAEKFTNIVGIKYSLPDMLRTDEYLHVMPEFSVVQGTDRLFLASLAMGCSGTVSGVSNVYPELFVAIYNAFSNGDLQVARTYQTYANLVCNALHCGSNMSYFKNGLKYRGLEGGRMRLPQKDLPMETVYALNTQLNEIEAQLPKDLLIRQ